MRNNTKNKRTPHGCRPPASTLRIYTDAALVFALTIIGFLFLSIFELEHTLIFVLALPIAIYTIRYSWLRAILPAMAIILFGPWVHADFLLHGYVLLPVAVIAGIIHGQVTNEMDNRPQLGFLYISLSEIILNFAVFLFFSVLLPDSHFNVFQEVEHLARLLPSLFNMVEGSANYIAFGSLVTGAIYAVVILVGIFEAMITHILVHSLATRVFKLERGHTFTSMPFMLPKSLTTAYISMSIVAWAFVGKLTQNPNNFVEMTILVAISLSIVGFALYFFEGNAVVNRYIAFRYHKRIALLNTMVCFILLPLTILLGISDSLFNIQPHVVMTLTKRIRHQRHQQKNQTLDK